MKRLDARGFTLAELMVVLALLALLSGMAAAGLNSFQKRARIAENREGAHRVYLAAEARLAELKSTGRLASWLQAAEEEAGAEAPCTLCLDRGRQTGAAWSLLENALTAEQLDAAICLQLDPDTGHLMAVYYDAGADALRPDPWEDSRVGCWQAETPAPPAAAPSPREALLWTWATPEDAAE